MPTERAKPETFLKRAQEEERQEQSGKLKIFLGASPGVGKTYAMLLDAIAKRKEDLDVVIGIVESHGRKEIESLLTGFEILPRQIVEYRNKNLTELDLDAVLKRNPALVLIDEMAHTNVPNLLHKKRWQDIKEILDRGIDVYTTLNVQHIESLNDSVSQIIHSRVKETVPDSMIDRADTIELIDLPPEDLLKRLQEGKVYFPEQALLAKEYFFRKGNLNALRELALRFTAQRVNTQVLLYRQHLGIKHIWPTREKILVGVSSKSEMAKIIRTAKRIAKNLKAEWMAVYVNVTSIRDNSAKLNSAMQYLRLAKSLGAETYILSGFDIVKELMNIAREQNVTQIIIGKKIHSRWRDYFFPNLADEIVRHSGEIDVYIVTSAREELPTDSKAILLERKGVSKATLPWLIYCLSIAGVGIATFIDWLLFPFLNIINLMMVYLICVTIIALFGEIGPAIVVSILSTLVFDYLFIPPYLNFSITDLQYILTLSMMSFIAYVISRITILLRHQVQQSKEFEKQSNIINALNQRITSAHGINNILHAATGYLDDIFKSKMVVLLPEEDGLIIKTADHDHINLDAKEKGIAQWVFDLGQPAGLGTDTLSFSDSLYIPLIGSRTTIGVVRITPSDPNAFLSLQKMHALEACVNQLGLALEVDELQEKAKNSELQKETDKVRNILLRSVSHDLRTPIIACMGMAGTLMDKIDILDHSTLIKLSSDIYNQLSELNHLIHNLLQMTYFEGESITLEKHVHSIKESVLHVVQRFHDRWHQKKIEVHVSDALPGVPFDEALIEEVLFNLIDNAVKFTPEDTPIIITLSAEGNNILVSIEDHGPGIMTDEMSRLFEKFYRGRLLTSKGGMGLGLSICQAIVAAHGGKIWAENNKRGSGAVFHFMLPF